MGGEGIKIEKIVYSSETTVVGVFVSEQTHFPARNRVATTDAQHGVVRVSFRHLSGLGAAAARHDVLPRRRPPPNVPISLLTLSLFLFATRCCLAPAPGRSSRLSRNTHTPAQDTHTRAKKRD